MFLFPRRCRYGTQCSRVQYIDGEGGGDDTPRQSTVQRLGSLLLELGHSVIELHEYQLGDCLVRSVDLLREIDINKQGVDACLVRGIT